MSGSTVALDHLGSSQTSTTYLVTNETVAVSWAGRVLTRLPLSIPTAEIYYWTRQWQADEGQAVAELEEGLGRRFEDSASAIRWLLNPDA